MAAANNGHFGTVDILLNRGADPDMQDKVSVVSGLAHRQIHGAHAQRGYSKVTRGNSGHGRSRNTRGYIARKFRVF